MSNACEVKNLHVRQKSCKIPVLGISNFCRMETFVYCNADFVSVRELKMEQYIVTGMSCAACQARVEKAVSRVPGVTSVSVSLLTNSMGVDGSASEAEIIKAVEAAGYGADKKTAERSSASEMNLHAEEEALRDRETPVLKKRLLFSAVFLLILMYISMGHNMWGWPLPPFLHGNYTGLALTQLLLSATVMIINGKFYTGRFGILRFLWLERLHFLHDHICSFFRFGSRGTVP